MKTGSRGGLESLCVHKNVAYWNDYDWFYYCDLVTGQTHRCDKEEYLVLLAKCGLTIGDYHSHGLEFDNVIINK